MSQISLDYCACQHNKLKIATSQETQDMSGGMSCQAASASLAAATRDIETATRSIHSTCAGNSAPEHATSPGSRAHTRTSRQSERRCAAARTRRLHVCRCTAVDSAAKPQKTTRKSAGEADTEQPDTPDGAQAFSGGARDSYGRAAHACVN
jgi:hypothetical protein